jgi:hypothetical protein
MPDLINTWLAARAEWAAANMAGRPVGDRNRLMDRVLALGRDIAARAELHDEVVALCGPAMDADVRLAAALVREHWDVDGAADTFVSLVRSSGASITRPVTMTSALNVSTTTTARNAALCLLNIDSGRGNTGAAHG